MKQNPRPKWPMPTYLADNRRHRNHVFVTRIRGVDCYHYEVMNWPDRWVRAVALVRGGQHHASVVRGVERWLSERNDFHPEARAFALSLLNLIS